MMKFLNFLSHPHKYKYTHFSEKFLSSSFLFWKEKWTAICPLFTPAFGLL